MKKIFGMLSGLLCIGLSLSACGYVGPGEEGIIVNSLGDSKGVVTEPVGTGYHYLGWFSHLYTFPTFTQNYNWTDQNREQITFADSGGLSVVTDIGISYHVVPGKVPELFQKYRRGIEEITDIYLHNMVRDSLNEIGSKHPIEFIYGEGKSQIITDVQKAVEVQVKDYGIEVEKVYWIGQLHLPDAVTTSINNKIQATQLAQQKQNELVQAQADAAKVVATANGDAQSTLLKANAQAQANKALAASISPELTRYLEVQRWDGKLPMYSGAGTTMLLNAPNGRN